MPIIREANNVEVSVLGFSMSAMRKKKNHTYLRMKGRDEGGRKEESEEEVTRETR